MSGEEVLPHIENIPVIVLRAKVDVQDKVNLLLGGAADYMTKPFDTKELLARIIVQLRKAIQHDEIKFLSVGDLVMDMVSLSLTVQGQTEKLTRTEFAILKLLMENPEYSAHKFCSCTNSAEYFRYFGYWSRKYAYNSSFSP